MLQLCVCLCVCAVVAAAAVAVVCCCCCCRSCCYRCCGFLPFCLSFSPMLRQRFLLSPLPLPYVLSDLFPLFPSAPRHLSHSAVATLNSVCPLLMVSNQKTSRPIRNVLLCHSAGSIDMLFVVPIWERERGREAWVLCICYTHIFHR